MGGLTVALPIGPSHHWCREVEPEDGSSETWNERERVRERCQQAQYLEMQQQWEGVAGREARNRVGWWEAAGREARGAVVEILGGERAAGRGATLVAAGNDTAPPHGLRPASPRPGPTWQST